MTLLCRGTVPGDEESKLVKSERINSLRKQYDAFLAEDKKRKERNEYILSKIEKMRHVTAVVPVRHKTNINAVDALGPVVHNRSVFMPEKSIQLSRPNASHLELDIQRNCYEETPLINELSKKYILIPRIRPILTNDYVKDIKQTNNNSTDWRSKYDILDKLKLNENKEQVDKYEVPSDNHFSQPHGNKTPSLGTTNLHEDLNLNKYQRENDHLILNYKNELPEKPFNDSEGIEKYKDNEKVKISPKAGITTTKNKREAIAANKGEFNQTIEDSLGSQNKDYQETNNDYLEYDSKIDFERQPTKLANNKSVDIPEIELSNTNVVSEYSSKPLAYKGLANEEKFHIEDPENVILEDGGDIGSVDIINPNNLVKGINDEVPVKEETIPTHNTANYIETIHPQEVTPSEDVTLEDAININPEGNLELESNFDPSNQYESEIPKETDHINNPVDTTEIQQLDTENTELHSENTDANYVYNQEHEENPYNAEYTPQSENYVPNEENAYYEGTQPELSYPAELNEQEAPYPAELNKQEVPYPAELHEPGESAEQYDQTYEQQYANFEQPDYVQQQEEYEQQPQQYEQQPTTYEPQPTAYEPQPTTYEPQPTAYEPQPTEYEPQPTAYEPQPTEYEPQPTAYEQQPTGYEPQPTAYEPQPTEYEPQPTTYEPQPTAYEGYDQTHQDSDQLQYEQQQQNYNSEEQVQQLDTEHGFVGEENIREDNTVAQGNLQSEQDSKEFSQM